MSSHEDGPDGPALISIRTMEVAVALILIVVAAVVIADSIRVGIGWKEDEGPSGGYFPFYIGLILGGASVVNLVRAVMDRRGGARTFTTAGALRQVLAVLVPLCFYVAFVALVSIYVASALYIALFMWYFGKYAIWRGALTGLALAAVFFLMFEVWFLVPLPKTEIETALVTPLREVFSGLALLLGL